MNNAESFGLAVLVAGLAGTAAVLSNRLSERLRVPAPAFFLIGAAAVAQLRGSPFGVSTVQDVVTVALAIILFDGGMHMGWGRFRASAGAILWSGVAGTIVTAVGAALCAHMVFGFGWRLSLLLGTAVSATDPAVVFSVFGRREVAGRTGTLLEGESGANDPVGISLLIALLAASGSAWSVAGHVAIGFALQMVAGLIAGVLGGRGLLWFMRRVPLPSEGLYAPRVLAGMLCIYGAAAVAHGSGFLAVFVAGIVIGGEPAPYQREIHRFHSSLASLAEIAAFIMLGLTVRLSSLADGGVWATGLGLAALLAFVIRPVLVGLVTLPIRLRRSERVFFLWTGLKGAVPILLGTFLVSSGTPGAQRAYEIIFVIVGFSVTLQGGLIPALAHRLRIPLRSVEPEPWSLGVRLRTEPEGLHRYHVAEGSPADGTTIRDLPCGEDVWISLIIRNGALVAADADMTMRPGDDILVMAGPADTALLDRLFGLPGTRLGAWLLGRGLRRLAGGKIRRLPDAGTGALARTLRYRGGRPGTSRRNHVAPPDGTRTDQPARTRTPVPGPAAAPRPHRTRRGPCSPPRTGRQRTVRAPGHPRLRKGHPRRHGSGPPQPRPRRPHSRITAMRTAQHNRNLTRQTQETGALAAALTAASQGDLTTPATIHIGTQPGHTGAGPAAACSPQPRMTNQLPRLLQPWAIADTRRPVLPSFRKRTQHSSRGWARVSPALAARATRDRNVTTAGLTSGTLASPAASYRMCPPE